MTHILRLQSIQERGKLHSIDKYFKLGEIRLYHELDGLVWGEGSEHGET